MMWDDGACMVDLVIKQAFEVCIGNLSIWTATVVLHHIHGSGYRYDIHELQLMKMISNMSNSLFSPSFS